MTEQWRRWEPISNISANYYIDSISDNTDGFRIVLSESYNKTKKVKIIFKDSVYAYRSTYESFSLQLLHDLNEKYGKEFYTGWAFFKITHSKYMNWLSELSCGITDTLQLTHFSIFALDSIVDIVATYEPIFEVSEELDLPQNNCETN